MICVTNTEVIKMCNKQLFYEKIILLANVWQIIIMCPISSSSRETSPVLAEGEERRDYYGNEDAANQATDNGEVLSCVSYLAFCILYFIFFIWRNFRFFHICPWYKSKISPHDNFSPHISFVIFATNMRYGIREYRAT